MKKLFFLFTVIAFAAACTGHGDKYQVNDKSEIYYKDGMTSGDAKLLGDFLLKNGYLDSITQRSVHLSRENDSVTVKFVDEKNTQDGGSEALYTIMGSAISAEVFGAKPLRMVLTDGDLKTKKVVPIAGVDMSEPAK